MHACMWDLSGSSSRVEEATAADVTWSSGPQASKVCTFCKHTAKPAIQQMLKDMNIKEKGVQKVFSPALSS